jgi:hypothetical protein
MNTKLLTATIFLTALASACSSTGNSSQAAAPVDQQAMMAKWMEFATPGEAHKALAPKVGRWNLKVKAFNPGQPPEESMATSEIKWIMDGRFLQDTTSGTAMGQPFSGMGLAGYDNLKKQYFSTWMDNMGTGVMVSTGHYDPASKTFTFKGTMPDVMAGKYMPSRSVEKWIDNDHSVVQMYQTDSNGKDR